MNRKILAAAIALMGAFAINVQAVEVLSNEELSKIEMPKPTAEDIERAKAIQALREKKEPFPVKDKVTVVDFGASWCASCPEMAQRMKDLEKRYGHLAAFVTIDIDDYYDIEKKWLIEQMPSQIFFDRRGEPIWQHTGEATEEEIMERVDALNTRDGQGNLIENPPKHIPSNDPAAMAPLNK